MNINDYGLPIKIFYANMLRIGVTFELVDGRLRVGGNLDIMTPVIQDEIIKRREHIVDLLTPAPSAEMASYFGRLLTRDEVLTALNTAKFLNEAVDALPVNGGWLLTTDKNAKVPV
jgi:hypothetical protein